MCMFVYVCESMCMRVCMRECVCVCGNTFHKMDIHTAFSHRVLHVTAAEER